MNWLIVIVQNNRSKIRNQMVINLNNRWGMVEEIICYYECLWLSLIFTGIWNLDIWPLNWPVAMLKLRRLTDSYPETRTVLSKIDGEISCWQSYWLYTSNIHCSFNIFGVSFKIPLTSMYVQRVRVMLYSSIFCVKNEKLKIEKLNLIF